LNELEEQTHFPSDFASPIRKSAIVVQKGTSSYEEPKKEKEIPKAHFKLQIPDVTHEPCHLVFLFWLQNNFISSYATVIL